jgi:hypothetical protein
VTDDDRKILLRKRVEMRWSQTRRDLTSREAIFDLWWRYFKAGILDLAGLRAFRLSSGFYQRKFNRKPKDLACNN